jgi:hypothetical protein
MHAPTRSGRAALGDEPAMTQLGGELPGVGDAPLAVGGLEQPRSILRQSSGMSVSV